MTEKLLDDRYQQGWAIWPKVLSQYVFLGDEHSAEPTNQMALY